MNRPFEGAADPYATGVADGTKLERAAVVTFLRREASGLSPIVRELLRDLARNVESGQHRTT